MVTSGEGNKVGNSGSQALAMALQLGEGRLGIKMLGAGKWLSGEEQRTLV